MESSRAKIAGPAIAAGAVSLGLILIGACGLGKHDTYVAPPPIKSAVDAEPVVRDGTTSMAPKVIIPPSPTWRVAPDAPPRRTVSLTDPSASGESTTQPSRTVTLHATTPLPEPPAPAPPYYTAEPERTTTTRPRPTTVEPAVPEEPTTTTRRPAVNPPDDE